MNRRSIMAGAAASAVSLIPAPSKGMPRLSESLMALRSVRSTLIPGFYKFSGQWKHVHADVKIEYFQSGYIYVTFIYVGSDRRLHYITYNDIAEEDEMGIPDVMEKIIIPRVRRVYVEAAVAITKLVAEDAG